ncbi:ABTB2 [Branchiostoma lanceolatum]|uniref:ABTB2 protein n=1 Tax=Branchiostoma lanceolatum TaxID=7740 RepID=A0A8K0EMD4_BRALA|nr:ABTB2 [Branchiostoma lanceolatum]
MAGMKNINQHLRSLEKLSLDSASNYSTMESLNGSIGYGTGSKSPTSHMSSHMNGTLTNGAGYSESFCSVKSSVPDDYECTDRYTRLVEIENIPWTEKDIAQVIENGQGKNVCDSVSRDIIQRLSYLLQRPLVRIVREAQRLAIRNCKCTQHDMKTAVKLVLSRTLAESCINSAKKAVSRYVMTGQDGFRVSKRTRAGVIFSVGRMYRWLIDVGVSPRLQDNAAVYLVGLMEKLLDEIFLRAVCMHVMGRDDDMSVSVELLEYGIANDPDLWGILQPFEHLICGRDANGILAIPSASSSPSERGSDHSRRKGHRRDREQLGSLELLKTLEQSLLTTCVGSIAELGDLVSRAMHHQHHKNGSRSPSPALTLTWGSDALHTLFYFMKCTQLECMDNPNIEPPMVQLSCERPYVILPPLTEWIRVATAHTEHRQSWVVDSDDVRQAARLLLPGVDCEPRSLRMDDSVCSSRTLDATAASTSFQRDLGFRMLSCGRIDLVQQAIAIMGESGINTINDHGMTPLMYACASGDEAMVQMLLDAHADPDVAVPMNTYKYPSVRDDIRGWTALSFAVVHIHVSIAQLLLDAGASVEGSAHQCGENYTETPLQLAAAAGHFELVSLLLTKGADPTLGTMPKNSMTPVSSRGNMNCFAQAAANGHRNVLRKLVSAPHISRPSDVLSLEEMLSEGCGNTSPVTSPEFQLRTCKLRIKALQEAMYHGAEHGYLDITMELRGLGVPWTLHTWMCTLSTAQHLHRKAIIQYLLREFPNLRPGDYSPDFCQEALPLMFEIFKQSKNEVISQQVATIFASCYGNDPIPDIPELRRPQISRIDPQYVNNPEMSDVTFIVEGKPFYAHKIILANASTRFKNMLSGKFSEGKQPCIEISDIRYQIFQIIMEYLYLGTNPTLGNSHADVLELLGASNFFMLDSLQRLCEILLSQHIDFSNAVNIYRHAKMYHAEELLSYCYGYFLRHLPELLEEDSVKKLVFHHGRSHRSDVLQELQGALLIRMQSRMKHNYGICVSS